jgi:hypothetical protein
MDEKLIALAEALDAARMTANSMEATAPQAGVYGQVSTALQSTLSLIVGDLAPRVYASIIEDGNNVRDAISYAESAAADETAAAELDEIETELIRKYSSSVYSVIPSHRSGQIWDMITYKAQTNERTPEADFAVLAFKTSYGNSTGSI